MIGFSVKIKLLKAWAQGAILRAMAKLHRISTAEIVAARNVAKVL